MGHSDEREAELFFRAMDAHVRMTGRKPRGYRAPVYNATPAVIGRLTADEMPYLLTAPGGELIELPAHWGNDDWPPFAHFEEIGYLMPVRALADGIRGFADEFDATRAVGGFWMPVLHPFLTDRLARWAAMEQWLENVLAEGDTWLAPMEQIARHARDHHDLQRVDDISEVNP